MFCSVVFSLMLRVQLACPLGVNIHLVSLQYVNFFSHTFKLELGSTTEFSSGVAYIFAI